jgi:cellobiose-specific phosphotransferase system component IIB
MTTWAWTETNMANGVTEKFPVKDRIIIGLMVVILGGAGGGISTGLVSAGSNATTIITQEKVKKLEQGQIAITVTNTKQSDAIVRGTTDQALLAAEVKYLTQRVDVGLKEQVKMGDAIDVNHELLLKLIIKEGLEP